MENNSDIKGVEYAREAIKKHSANPSKGGRVAMAKAAFAIGNYTDDAKALWKAYLDAGCPRG